MDPEIENNFIEKDISNRGRAPINQPLLLGKTLLRAGSF